MSVRILVGDCMDSLLSIPAESVNCCVTSPPYFGLRDYGVTGQIGLEDNPDSYISKLVDVFRQVRRVLRSDGTLWLNIGDSYNNFRSQMGPGQAVHGRETMNGKPDVKSRKRGVDGLKEKDLIGIPWMLAFALRADGWYLRQDIIWNKPNPMPESVRDRCTKAHEYIFLMSKSSSYYFDGGAMKEVAVGNAKGSAASFKREGSKRGQTIPSQLYGTHRPDRDDVAYNETRNRRSVWTVPTKPYRGAHFATFPTELIEPCIGSGCPIGGTVLDPFGGAGTTGVVADRMGRNAILCELNPDYAKIAEDRISAEAGMLSCVELIGLD